MQPDSLIARADILAGSSEFASGQDSLPVHHRFSVWRIYQQMPGCTPQQLDSAVQANLPIRERFRSECPDTLSLPGLPGRRPYEVTGETESCSERFSGYFRNNTMLHTELPYCSQGEGAISLPYTLWRDDWVTSSLLICLLILVYVINKTRKQLRQQAKDFFFVPNHPEAFSIKTNIESYSRLFMTFQLCLLGGVTMFAYSQYELDAFLGQLSPRWLLSSYMGAFILFFLLKRMLMSFVNWIFFPKSQQKIWNESYSFLNSAESIVFFFLALIFVYFRLHFQKFIWIILFILLITKILLAFKAYRIFFHKSYGLFHLFVYLCALEIMPLLALWKSLAIVTENLVVKY